MNSSLKKNKIIKIIKNNSKKSRSKLVKSVKTLTPKQRDIVCKQSSNTYNTFEDTIEEIFKKNKINIVSTSYNLEKQIISDLKKAVNPKNVQPNEDFYSYINDRWISDYELTENQKYIVQIDDFRIVQDKVYRELIEIIEDYIKDSPDKKSKKHKCIENAYNSFKGYNTRTEIRDYANTVLTYIDELSKDSKKVWELLAFFNRNEIISWGAPFVWTLNPIRDKLYSKPLSSKSTNGFCI